MHARRPDVLCGCGVASDKVQPRLSRNSNPNQPLKLLHSTGYRILAQNLLASASGQRGHVFVLEQHVEGDT
jgi:hypothetical protein